jgi:hypothetical protein
VATTSRATGGTSYSLVYGTKACLPPESLLDSPWVQYFNESMKEYLRCKDVDFTNKRRWQAAT